MDEIRREAMNDYKQRTKEQKQRVLDFFIAMDTDGNGSISIREFVAFLQQNGLYSDHLDVLFAELQKDDDGTLGLEEIITLKFMLDHDKYRGRFVATSSNVDTHKHKGGESDLKEILKDFIEKVTIEATLCIVAQAAAEAGCSIM